MNGVKPVSELTFSVVSNPPRSVNFANLKKQVESSANLKIILRLIPGLLPEDIEMAITSLQEAKKLPSEESKVNQVVQPIFKQVAFSPQKTRIFQEGVRKPDGDLINKCIKDPEVDVNQEMGVVVEPSHLIQRRQSMFAPSVSNSIPAPLKRDIPEGPVKVSPIYYTLYQYLVASISSATKAAYRLIFLDLLRNLDVGLNHRKKTAQNERDGGFAILHLAVLDSGNSAGLVDAILNTNRVDVNLVVEHIHDKSNYHGYTPLDLAVVKWEKLNQAPSESQTAIDVYQLLLKKGAVHAKKILPVTMKKALEMRTSKGDTLRRNRPQSALYLNGHANGYITN